jgi:hypothetical protein
MQFKSLMTFSVETNSSPMIEQRHNSNRWMLALTTITQMTGLMAFATAKPTQWQGLHQWHSQ